MMAFCEKKSCMLVVVLTVLFVHEIAAIVPAGIFGITYKQTGHRRPTTYKVGQILAVEKNTLICIENCAQCHRILDAFDHRKCRDHCYLKKGMFIPDCTDPLEMQKFLTIRDHDYI